jgi:(p)ppGpp synthase/HD superfamily hydrolase
MSKYRYGQNDPLVVADAYSYACIKHGDVKDDNGENYFLAHVCKVAEMIILLQSINDMHKKDNNLIAAAYLHDVVEDCGVTEEELREDFPRDVVDLVMEVTHEGKKDAHCYYFPRLKTQRGIMLKFADRLSNLSRMQAWDDNRKAQYLKRSKFWRSE